MLAAALLLAATTTAPATPGLCATLSCSVHKVDGRPCQCNFHCAAHNDCCSDAAAVCTNQTDPCLAHKCKGQHAPSTAAPSANATKAHAEHAAKAAHANSGNATAVEHAGKGGGKEGAKATASKNVTKTAEKHGKAEPEAQHG